MSTWQEYLVDDDAGLARIFRESRTIAVLGATNDRSRPAYYVPAYLKSRGYLVRAVTPILEGEELFGEPVVAALADLPHPVDVIDVFRRPAFLPGHATEILGLPWKPSVVWFQLGIRNDAAARRLAEAGIHVVQDRCMMPDHRRLLGAA
jgi:predicted CoA-binding protein